LLFCIVIISGAVRALRHPERYGPRRGDPTMDGPEGAPQTRAAGLTRAILDTFPVVKFGRGNIAAHQEQRMAEQRAAYSKPVQNAEWSLSQDMTPNQKPSAEGFEMTSPHPTEEYSEMNTPALGFTSSPRASTSSPPPEGQSIPRHRDSLPPGLDSPQADTQNEPTPEMIGTETCPICIIDFEDGDDLRVLPCEGHHKFHKDCVDPWLLELSSSCPLCRQDFLALENMANGVSPEEARHRQQWDAFPEPGSASPHNRPYRGFSRYLRTAQRRRDENDSSVGEDEAR